MKIKLEPFHKAAIEIREQSKAADEAKIESDRAALAAEHDAERTRFEESVLATRFLEKKRIAARQQSSYQEIELRTEERIRLFTLEERNKEAAAKRGVDSQAQRELYWLEDRERKERDKLIQKHESQRQRFERRAASTLEAYRKAELKAEARHKEVIWRNFGDDKPKKTLAEIDAELGIDKINFGRTSSPVSNPTFKSPTPKVPDENE